MNEERRMIDILLDGLEMYPDMGGFELSRVSEYKSPDDLGYAIGEIARYSKPTDPQHYLQTLRVIRTLLKLLRETSRG